MSKMIQTNEYRKMIFGLCKKSNSRLVVSGDIVEVYNYQRPYQYNDPYEERTPDRAGYKQNRREENLMVAQRYLRRLIFANVNVWSEQTAFITFTFAENITNLKKANTKWRKFARSLQEREGIKIKYTAVVEFQKRGAVHYHVLFYNLPVKYIRQIRTERRLAKLWGYGFVDIKTIRKMRSIRSVGAYVSKYLSKATLDERLRGEKVYFSSRGLSKPIEYRRQEKQEEVINQIKVDNKLELMYNENYTSRSYGNINYKQYIIIKK